MAKTEKNQLSAQIKRANPGPDKRRRDGYNDAMSNFVDSVYTVAANTGLTVSASGEVSIELTQPAKSYIEDVTVICTSGASIGASATVGFKLGTVASGEQVLAETAASIHAATTTVGAGTGSSTIAAISTSLDANASLGAIVLNSPFTSTERTLYATVATSTDAFDTNTGEFGVAVKYVQL